MKNLLGLPAILVAVSLGLLPSTGAAHGTTTHGDGPKHHKPNLDPVEKAFGRTGDPKKVSRTVRISGDDKMRYSPSDITVKEGETIRFVVRNTGKLLHEIVLGTMDELKEHAEMMRKHPGMAHEEPYMSHLGPGDTGEIVWQFTRAGEFHFGCLVPGHFEAGMKGRIRVIK